MKVLIIGATGGIGHRLLPMLIANGHEVVGLHRKPEQAETIRRETAEPHLGDVMKMSIAEFATAARGCDVVVFSAGAAGSGLDRTTAIDGDGPGKVVEAARKLGISRLYLVSAFPESARQRERNPRFEHYIAEKKRADVAVASSELDWVIIRPGTLQHEDGDGKISLGPAVSYGPVARGNVARVLAELIDRPGIRREIIELTDGTVPISEALDALHNARQGA